MDNQGFVVDENLRVVGHTQGHKKSCVMYSGGRCGPCGCITADPEVPVTIYGILKRLHIDKELLPRGGTIGKMLFNDTEDMALISMDDVTLQLQYSLRLSDVPGCVESRVRTDHGDLIVSVCGTRGKPAILTYHDIGLNYIQFASFFNHKDMREVLNHFCVYHVTSPYQAQHSQTLPENYVYPTVAEMANDLKYVLAFYGLRSVIGIGAGCGAHILAKFALAYPDMVDALALINCTSAKAKWVEWIQQARYVWALRYYGMTKDALEYLLWHHLGWYHQNGVSSDLVEMYREYFTREMNPINLAYLMDSYASRPDLDISRKGHTLRMPVLNITASYSPHVANTVSFNGKLNPRESTWMKISDCVSVLDEQPGKVAEAFRLFLQGQGYVAPLTPSKMLEYRHGGAGAGARSRRACRHSPVMRITENPISEAIIC